jgi:hypothetical protein
MARFNRLIGSQFILLDNSMQTIKKTSLHRFASIKKKKRPHTMTIINDNIKMGSEIVTQSVPIGIPTI